LDKALITLAILVLIGLLLIWMPWMTADKAASIAVSEFNKQQQEIVNGCGFDCTGCGVISSQKIYSGYLVEIEYACGVLPVDKPEFHQRSVVYISPFGTAQLLDSDYTALSAAVQLPLAGTEWVLITLNGQMLLDTSNITLEFDNEYAGGYGGCNYYGGRYYQSASEGLLTFEEVSSTLQDCSTPSGIMTQERAFLDAFLQTKTYRMVDSRLELTKQTGVTDLIFQRKDEYEMDPADLIGTHWQLSTMNGERLPEQILISMSFIDNNKLEGHAACRDYTARYEAEGDDIRLPLLSMQGESCEEHTDMFDWESSYIDILDRIINYRLDKDRLLLISVRNEDLVFTQLQ
jgi:heat shock protein HslJ